MDSKRIDLVVNFLLSMRYRPTELNGGTVKVIAIDKNKIVDTEYAFTEKGAEHLRKILE